PGSIPGMEPAERRRNDDAGAICLWPFDTAPAAYQEMSLDGGGEDWVMWVPSQMVLAWHEEPGGRPWPEFDPPRLMDLAEQLDTMRQPNYRRCPDGACVVIGSPA
ncbi:MAG: hypothetical protein ACRD0J_08165, partial [Acidimicrobiales bacterium]